MSCNPQGNPISGAIIDFLASNSKQSNEDWPIAPSIENSLDTIGSKFIPILALPKPKRQKRIDDYSSTLSMSARPTGLDDSSKETISNKNDVIVPQPNNVQKISLPENNEKDTNYNKTKDKVETYAKVERCPPTTSSMGFGELLREMIDAVAELLKSLLTLNFNSTLAEITGVVFCGNRLLYLLLLIVMFMFIRRLLVALFLF